MALLAHAFEAEEDDKFFWRWIVEGHSHKIGFDDYKQGFIQPPDKPAAEILDDVANIMTAWEVERDNGNI